METQKEKLGKVSITVEEDYWDINKVYKKLTIVERQSTGTTYLSRKPVPAGISISNRKYWIKFSKWSDIPYEITQEFGDSEELAISQKVITKKVDDLQDQINKLHPGTFGISISATPNIIYEDVESNVTIKGKMIDNSIADSIKIKIGENVVAEGVSISELETTEILTKTTTIYVEAIREGLSYENDTKVTSTRPYYVGSGFAYTEIINDAHKQSIKANPNGTYNVVVATAQTRVFFVVPQSMTINRATMSGFIFPLDSPQSVIVDGAAYKVYQSSNTYDAITLTIVIS